MIVNLEDIEKKNPVKILLGKSHRKIVNDAVYNSTMLNN